MTRAQTVDALARDVKFGVRTLGRQKGWTAVAILTLALGIGANTAIFGVVNSLILHTLPYPHADRMVLIYQEPSEGTAAGVRVIVTVQAGMVRAWRAGSHSLEAIEAFATTDMTLRAASVAPSVVHAAAVLPSFPAFAGVHPLLGRGFSKSDATDGRSVILSAPRGAHDSAGIRPSSGNL